MVRAKLAKSLLLVSFIGALMSPLEGLYGQDFKDQVAAAEGKAGEEVLGSKGAKASERTVLREVLIKDNIEGRDSPNIVEKTHSALSNKVINLSTSIDGLLGSKVQDLGGQTSNFKVQMGMSQLESEDALFNTKIKAQLVLPRTQKRFQLVMNNLKDEIREDFVRSTEEDVSFGEGAPKDTLNQSNFLMALRYKIRENQSVSISTDAGVKLNIPLDPFAKLKSKQFLKFGLFNVSMLESIHWFDSSGLGFNMGVDFSRSLSRDFSIRQSNLLSWEQEQIYREIRNEISLIQVIGDRRSISYFISARGNDENVIQVLSYTAGVSFNTWVGWQWLNFSLVPFYLYTRENEFIGVPGFTTEFIATVGYF